MQRTWYENTNLLERFREWLARTDQELAELPGDKPSDPVAETPDESYLDDSTSPLAVEDLALDRTIGWLQLVEAFTALRQELKLQTKSARGLDENVRSALNGLESASRQFQSVQAQEAQAAERAAQPFVEALIGLDESLERCVRALEAMQSRAMAQGPQQLLTTLENRFHQQSAWRRWWSRQWQQQVLEICRKEAAASQEHLWTGLMEGFELVRNRLRRAMDEQRVGRIPCIDRVVDPNQMTVVELVDDENLPAETVVAELRPGYTWRDRVIRYAEVRAVRSAPRSSSSPNVEGSESWK
jgi:molecular chaperone GrpE